MKKLLFLTILVSNYCIGQSLKFDTEYYDAVDKWVAFDKEESASTYIFGFIYIDEHAGFTFNYESDFKITEKGLEKIPREMLGYMKTRLEPNTAHVHILNDEQVQQLDLPEQPDWLKYYKSNEDKISYLTKIGYLFNHVGASKNAIEPLLKAYNIEPHYKGLEFELAYAYNATKNFEKAIEILTKAIKNDPKDFWFLRELGFAYLNSGNFEKAEETYIKGIALSDNKDQKAEMAINMTHGYFKTKNKPKFDEWAKITKQHTDEGSMFDKYINYWTENWDKQ